MNEKDLLAVALKHKLPMVSTTRDGAWSYAEQVLAFGRDLAGEEWPEEHAFPPLPFPVTMHPKLGNLYARFDLQMYAVQFERRSLAQISAQLGLHGEDAGNPELILQCIKDMRVHADYCSANSWWVKSLMEFWGNGTHDLDTRRAAKCALNLAAQFAAKEELNSDVLDLLADVLEAKEVMREAGCNQAPFGEMFSEFIGKRAAAPNNPESFEQFVKDEYGMTAEQAKRASFGLSGLRNAFEMGQRSKPSLPITADDPRDEFEKLFKLPANCIRCGDGYAATAHGAWQAHEFINKWEGFKAALKLKAGE